MRRFTNTLLASATEFQFTHPGRGATKLQERINDWEFKFQFTHPGRGATTGSGDPLPRLPSFNSRTPGGVRPSASISLTLIFGSFNSRTPGGVRRDSSISSIINTKVSIHAPREGCDLKQMTPIEVQLMFQFTHPGRGATAWCSLLSNCYTRFQFTHPGRGATDDFNHTDVIPKKFQFTHPGRGATPRCDSS